MRFLNAAIRELRVAFAGIRRAPLATAVLCLYVLASSDLCYELAACASCDSGIESGSCDTITPGARNCQCSKSARASRTCCCFPAASAGGGKSCCGKPTAGVKPCCAAKAAKPSCCSSKAPETSPAENCVALVAGCPCGSDTDAIQFQLQEPRMTGRSVNLVGAPWFRQLAALCNAHVSNFSLEPQTPPPRLSGC